MARLATALGQGRLGGQRGFSFFGMALVICLFAGTLVLLLRVFPPYIEYRAVNDVINRAAADYNPDRDSLNDLRVRIRKLLMTSQVYDITADDIDLYRDKGRVVIDANYEIRFHLLWRLDGVMVFDDLVVTVTSSDYP